MPNPLFQIAQIVSSGLSNVAMRENLALTRKPRLEPNMAPQALLRPPMNAPESSLEGDLSSDYPQPLLRPSSRGMSINDGIIRRLDLEKLLNLLPMDIDPEAGKPVSLITPPTPEGLQPKDFITPITPPMDDRFITPVDPEAMGPTIETIPPLDIALPEIADILKQPYTSSKEDLKGEKGKIIYHGTDKIFKDFDIQKSADGSIWFTDNKSKIEKGEVSATGKGQIMERIIDEKKLKLGGWEESDKYSTDELIAQGYDGLKLVDKDETTYQIFNPSKLQSTPPTAKGGEIVSKNPELQKAFDNAMSKIPEDMRKDINIKGLRQIEFPDEYAGEGGRLERDGKDQHWIFIEKGEKNIEDTILHEAVHSYVLKHPEIVKDGYFGMEDAVNKITAKLSPTVAKGGEIYEVGKKYNKVIPEIKSVDPNILELRDYGETAFVSDEVAKNMKFDEPIKVSVFADGKVKIADGHHRVAAAKKLGMKQIPAEVQSINAKGSDINKLIEASKLSPYK